jgi:hypothetical protein
VNELVAALDRACPGFVPHPDEAELPYSWVGSFVRHVIATHLRGDISSVAAAFAVIEREIATDGPQAELAIIGFLEDMQNGNLHPPGSRPGDFTPYLGPVSTQRWSALNGFWQAAEWNKSQ